MTYGSDGVHVDADRIATGRSLERASEALNALVNAITAAEQLAEEARVATEDADSRFTRNEPRLESALFELRHGAVKHLAAARDAADKALGKVADILRDE